MYIQYKNSQT